MDCNGCEKRAVGCHNVETCEIWAAHEAKKPERYAKRREREETRRKPAKYVKGKDMFVYGRE